MRYPLPFDGRRRTHLGNKVFESPLLESSLELVGTIILWLGLVGAPQMHFL